MKKQLILIHEFDKMVGYYIYIYNLQDKNKVYYHHDHGGKQLFFMTE